MNFGATSYPSHITRHFYGMIIKLLDFKTILLDTDRAQNHSLIKDELHNKIYDKMLPFISDKLKCLVSIVS